MQRFHTRKKPSWASVIMLAWGLGISASSFAQTSSLRSTNAEALLAQGQYQKALAAYQCLVTDAEREHDTNSTVSFLISLASCQQSLGLHCEGLDSLESANAMVGGTTTPSVFRMRVEAALGNAYAVTRRYAEGERLLRSSLETATQLQDDRARLSILQNLGNLLAVRPAETGQGSVQHGRGSMLVYLPARDHMPPIQEALQCYDQAIGLAQASSDQQTMIRLLLNKARAQIKRRALAGASATAGRTATLLNVLPDSREKAFLEVSTARCLCDIDDLAHDNSNPLSTTALGLLDQAKQMAEAAQDGRTASFAWGYLADIYQRRKESKQALSCAEQALFRSQQFGNDDARFHWEWLVGGILREQGERERAVTWYRQATQTLQSRRGDFYAGLSQRAFGTTFHESLGDVYYELADLLLQQAADPATKADAAKALTLEARQSIEMLKTIELESYFLGDDCNSLLKKQTRDVDQVDPGTAVIYYVPLPNRTEILVSLQDGLHRVTSAATSSQIVAEARQFRAGLETPASNDYLAPAQHLWQWLIQPVAPILKGHKVKTLVFIPDAKLRGVPMAALYDGQRYLVEDYAIAVSPGLSLLGSGESSCKRPQALICGLSEPVQNHAELKCVPAELQGIGGLFKSTALLNEQFRVPAFQQAILRGDASIVHIASHAHFGGDAGQSYILTFDDRLTIDRLGEIIEPRLLSPVPIELLTLSACQTAAGDDRSTLGLAGVAVKSGARSTLATLWSVNDESTQLLMTRFYQNLKQQAKSGKAVALRDAQCALMADPRFRHPFFWSPYLLIGDWL